MGEVSGHWTEGLERHARSWWSKALLTSAAGVVVSVIVAAITVAGLRLDLGPVIALERAGADAGMRLRATFHLDRAQAPDYVFVDVDETACAAFRRERTDAERLGACRTGTPMSIELVADFVGAVSRSGASVAIIDLATLQSDADLERLGIALASGSGPPVIVPFPGRAGREGDELIHEAPATWTRTLPSLGARLRLAPFETMTDPAAGDGVIRGYPAFLGVKRGEVVTSEPSAPYLASRLVRARSADPSPATSSDAAADRDAFAGRLWPIVFTLPSLSLQSPSHNEADRLRQERDINRWTASHYRRLLASELVVEGRGRFSASAFPEGAVVVLGSSLPSGLDQHLTPLGLMTGSELILNATRAFAAVPSPEALRPRADLWTDLELKLGSALRGGLLMTGIWLAIFLVWDRVRRRGRALRLAGRAAAGFLFICGLLAVGLLELRDASAELQRSLAAGRHVDILTPIVALGLEGYAEGIRLLTHAIERGLLTLVGSAVAMLRSGLAFFSLWRGGGHD
jgi:hypothetical protein